MACDIAQIFILKVGRKLIQLVEHIDACPRRYRQQRLQIDITSLTRNYFIRPNLHGAIVRVDGADNVHNATVYQSLFADDIPLFAGNLPALVGYCCINEVLAGLSLLDCMRNENVIAVNRHAVNHIFHKNVICHCFHPPPPPLVRFCRSRSRWFSRCRG